MSVISGIIIWAGLCFWVWPYILGLFGGPDEGWWRLIIYILWGANLAIGPFMLTVVNLEAIIKGYLK